MAAIDPTTGESGMLLIGADGSIKLHGGSTIFSGDNQSQHSLLAQKNTDGTMNVYMIPSDGPNKGKMFMVMPSANGGADGQGWKMVNLHDGKTILTPTYRQNSTVYVPPTVLPPHIENVMTNTARQNYLPSFSKESSSPQSVTISPIVIPTSMMVTPNSVVNTTVSSLPMNSVSFLPVNTVPSLPVNTDTVTSTPNTISWTEQGTKFTFQLDNSKGKTQLAQENIIAQENIKADTLQTNSETNIRPMWLFTHKAAASLGKNVVIETSATGDLQSSLSNGNEIKAPISVVSNKIIYPVIASVNKPNILSKVKTTAATDSTNSVTDSNVRATFVSPLTNAPVFRPGETLAVGPSSVNLQPIQSLKNVVAVPGKTLSNGNRQIVVYPKPQTTEVLTLPSISADSKVSNPGYISLLSSSKSDASRVPSTGTSTSSVKTLRPVPIAANPGTKLLDSSKLLNGHYIITLRAETPVTKQNSTLTKSLSPNFSKACSTIAQTLTTASNAITVRNFKGPVALPTCNSKQPLTVSQVSLPNDNASKCGPVTQVVKRTLSSRNAINTTFATNTVSVALSKVDSPTVLSNLASSALQTVADHVRGAKFVHLELIKENEQKPLQSIRNSSEQTLPVSELSKPDEDLSIRIDSVFSLINPEGEEADSAEGTKSVINSHVSEKNSESIISKNGGSTRSQKAENILNVMENVKLPKEAIFDPLLNRPTYVVLEKCLPEIYSSRNKLTPCNRQCREHFIRRRETQKLKDLKYKIDVLKSKIRDKKWKTTVVNGKNKSQTSSGNGALKKVDSYDDIEMPKLEPAYATEYFVASGSEMDMPDIRSSLNTSQNKIDLSGDSAGSILSPNLKVSSGLSPGDVSNKQSHFRMSNINSNDQPKIGMTCALPIGHSHVKIPYKLIETPVTSGTVKVTPQHSVHSSVPLSHLTTRSSPIVSFSIPSTAASTNVTASAAGPGVNTKFYLIKVDDKSILIPAVNTGTQPRAYILDPKSQSDNKLVPSDQNTNKSLSAATHGFSDLRLVVPSVNPVNTKLTNTWSNPPSVDSNRVVVCTNASSKSTAKQSIVSANMQANESLSNAGNTFGNISVKQEPVMKGYGDQIATIKQEKYRGYSDEIPPLLKSTNGSVKRLNDENLSSHDSNEHTNSKVQKIDEHTNSKVQKIDEEKSEEEKAQEEAIKEKRIKNLKDMLKKQEQALEELRRKRFSETPPALDMDDIM